jgi:hypothetical protein
MVHSAYKKVPSAREQFLRERSLRANPGQDTEPTKGWSFPIADIVTYECDEQGNEMNHRFFLSNRSSRVGEMSETMTFEHRRAGLQFIRKYDLDGNYTGCSKLEDHGDHRTRTTYDANGNQTSCFVTEP